MHLGDKVQVSLCSYILKQRQSVLFLKQAGFELETLLPHPPSRVLGLQACTTTRGIRFKFWREEELAIGSSWLHGS
jgi:hypothetical protein